MNFKQRLLDVAEVLEKTAAYIEAQEAEQLCKQRKDKDAKARVLSEKISSVVGEPLDEDTVEKLSELSPEMSNILQQLTGGDTVDSLGGPSATVKTAGVRNNVSSDTVAIANTRFIDWLST